MRRLTAAPLWLAALSTVTFLALSGCSYVAELRAVRFEPLSDSLRGDETEVDRHWEGVRDGSPHRVLTVRRDGLEVRATAIVGGSPGSVVLASAVIDLRIETGAEVTLDRESVDFRPKYAKRKAQGPASLVMREAKVGVRATADTATSGRRIEVSFEGGVPTFKKAVLDFALVREDTGERYVYRFHLK